MTEPVICPYCCAIKVALTEYDDAAEMREADGTTVVGVWAEGDCENCGQHVEYDHDPVGVVAFENGRAVYDSAQR